MPDEAISNIIQNKTKTNQSPANLSERTCLKAPGNFFSPALFLLIHPGRREAYLSSTEISAGIQTRFMAADQQRYTIKDLQSRNNKQ